MKKTSLISLVCALVLVLSVSVCAAGFEKKRTYSEGMFSDIKAGAWYASDIKNAYELEFLNGKGDGVMAPDGNVTVAEAITIASRLHSIYNSREIPAVSGNQWYDMYISYAKNAGIIDENAFGSYDRPVRRYEMAVMFANALPKSYYNAKNSINAIPDINENEEYADELLMLYRAGVVLGSDKYGTFHPTNSIKRCEAAAIINRAALPGNRVSGTLEALPEYKEAFYLIDNYTMTYSVNSKSHLASGWNYENRFSEAVDVTAKTTNMLSDTSDTGYVAINRSIEPQSKGIMTLDVKYNISQGADGVRIYFTDSDGKNVFELCTENGVYNVKAKEYKPTATKVKSGENSARVSFNLDKKAGVLEINGKRALEFELGDFRDFARIYISTTAEDKVTIAPTEVHLYVNYPVNEDFAHGTVPYNWTGNGKIESLYDSRDSYSLVLSDNGKAQTAFSPVSGKVVFESYVYLPEKASSGYVAFTNGTNEDVKISLADGVIKANGIEKSFFNNIWQVLHIEADTQKKTASVYINGKLSGTVPFAHDAFDGIVFGFDKKATAGKMYIDDVKVYNVYDYADYVSAPVKAQSDDYVLIMSVCSLWREGTHYGWDCVSAYDECSPLIGYYDEGIPEASDWEVKQMAEHGIDAQQFCWFAAGTDFSVPQKHPKLAWQLHDGYFYGKYSDAVDFCILWENSSFRSSKMTLDQFKTFLWDYWVEYYFKDDRYLTVDNNAVFQIYDYDIFVNTFGGVDGCKKVISFMKQEIRRYGYNGMIVLFSDGGQDAGILSQMNAMGADGIMPYAWGASSYDPAYLEGVNKAAVNNVNALKKLSYVPTVSAGRNIIGWMDIRTPMSTLPQHAQVLEDAKKALAMQTGKSGAWRNKMIYFSTWNEFGEGHWIAPSGLNGYGYADEWRKAFTKAPVSHDDAVPTINQKNRISHLYNDERTPIRANHLESNDELLIPEKVVMEWEFENEEAIAALSKYGYSSFEAKDGILYGTTSNNDPMIHFPQNMGLKAEDVDAIHVRLKTNRVDGLQIFFNTETDRVFNERKGFSANVEPANEWIDLYIETAQNDLWAGTVNQIRLDVMNAPGKVELDCFELLAYSERQTPIRVAVDGIELNFPADYQEKTADEFYVAAYPETGIFSACNFYYEWNRFTGRLYIKSQNGTEMEFVLGSDKALVNGKENKLSRTVTLYDGIPVIPLLFTLRNAGVDYKFDNGLEIDVRGINFAEIAQNRVEGEYEFNLPGDSEGWKENGVAMTVADGNMTFTAKPTASTYTGYDPGVVLEKQSFRASNYKELVIRMKYELYDNGNGTFDDGYTLYFATTAEGTLGENKAFRGKLGSGKDDGDGYKLYTIPLRHEKWTGTVHTIRFDPSNNNGMYSIDYIKLVKDENAVEDTPEVQEPKEEVNGGVLVNEKLDGNGTLKLITAMSGVVEGWLSVKSANAEYVNFEGKNCVKFTPANQWPHFEFASTSGLPFGKGKGKYTVNINVYIPSTSKNIDCVYVQYNNLGAKRIKAQELWAGEKLEYDKWIPYTWEVELEDASVASYFQIIVSNTKADTDADKSASVFYYDDLKITYTPDEKQQ